MTIAIDCRMINASGIGVYLRGCLPFILKSEHQFLLIGNAVHLHSFSSYPNAAVINCGIKPFSIKELFFFPGKIIRRINTSAVYYSPFFNIPCGIAIPVFTTIHDIIFPDMPDLSSKTGLAVRMFFFRRAYKKSSTIFTVSEFSKSRIMFHLGKTKPVIVTHSAIQPLFLEYRSAVKNTQKKETIVFIGNIKKHKGLDCLIEAFKLAKEKGLPHRLIIIGSKENFRTSDNAILQKINSLGAESVSFTGLITDEQLLEYLSEASLLVQPSLYEGFGLPPLEAMTVGTQALISDIPVFKEIYDGFPVTFFRAGDSIDLKNKILYLLLNKNFQGFSIPENLLDKYTFQKTSTVIMENFYKLSIGENRLLPSTWSDAAK